MRSKFHDPGSAQATGIVNDQFTVSFVFICGNDILSIDLIADQTFNLGDTVLTTTVTTGQTEPSCASFTSLVYETFDDVYKVWVLASTKNWYQSENASSLTVFINANDYAEY